MVSQTCAWCVKPVIHWYSTVLYLGTHHRSIQTKPEVIDYRMQLSPVASCCTVGMRAQFLHVGLIVTVQLLIYDMVKQLVGIGAMGQSTNTQTNK